MRVSRFPILIAVGCALAIGCNDEAGVPSGPDPITPLNVVDMSDVPHDIDQPAGPRPAFSTSPTSSSGLTVRSWSNQRGGDLDGAGGGGLQYSFLEQGILGAGHTILPGVTTLVSNLSGVNAFFHGTGGPNISGLPADQAAALAANQAGVCFMIEANSASSEQASAQALINALGAGGPAYTGGVGGAQTSNAGLFVGAGNSTVGPFGNLVGGRFGSSLVADINPMGHPLIGMNGNIRAWVEWQPCPTCGSVMVVGDPYGFNLFMNPAASLYNPNNLNAYLNFLANCILIVEIDIKPGSFPNSINPKSNGVVPVAILGSADFDVTDVDVTTLEFGPAGAMPAHDLTNPATYADHLQDVNLDGYTDLVSHYRQKETGLMPGDTEACIEGATTGGAPLQGCDSVNVLDH